MSISLFSIYIETNIQSNLSNVATYGTLRNSHISEVAVNSETGLHDRHIIDSFHCYGGPS